MSNYYQYFASTYALNCPAPEEAAAIRNGTAQVNVDGKVIGNKSSNASQERVVFFAGGGGVKWGGNVVFPQKSMLASVKHL